MTIEKGQLAGVAAVVLLVLGMNATVLAQNNVDLRVGDVLAAVGNGSYQVFDPSFTSLGTIHSGTGDTRGCAIDSSYHPFTTDLSGAAIRRWNVDEVPSFNIPNQVISTISNAGAESLALDSLGNLYAGQPGGNGCVLRYNVSGNFQGYLPSTCTSTSGIKGGTAWIDLNPTAATVYFGNGSSKTVNQFSASCSTSPKNCVSSFGPNIGTVFGVRVLTPDAVTGSGGSGYLLAAAGAQVALLDSAGNLVRSYTATVPTTNTSEKDFEVLTLLAGGAQFAAGSPSTHTIYIFNYGSSTPVSSISLGAGPAGMCTYGLANAAQPQPQLANVLSCSAGSGTASLLPPGGNGCGGFTSNTAAFDLPGDNPASKLLVTFPHLINPGKLTARVTQVAVPPPPGLNPVPSDPNVIASNTGLPEGGNFVCTSDGTQQQPGNCYIWEVEPSGITLGVDFTYADVSLNQGPGDPSLHLLKNEAIDVNYYSGPGLDIGGAGRSSLSVYSLNNFVPSGGVNGETVCPTVNNGYTSPVVFGQTYNFGRVVPFKFEVCDAAGNILNNPLDSTAYLALVQCGTSLAACNTFLSASQAPPTAVIDVSGNSGAPPIYRFSAPQYILNVDSSNLGPPPVCYFATTFAPAIPSFRTVFCLN